MDTDRLNYLLTQKQSGVITLSERLELAGLIRQNSNIAFVTEAVEEVFNSQVKYEIDETSVNKALSKLNKKINTNNNFLLPGNKGIKRFWPAIAACFLLLSVATALLISPSQKSGLSPVADNVVMTLKGSKTSLILPDGTKVWLNADSKLNYDKNFGQQTREVSLTGEAYFDVVKNKEIPFIVRTAAIEVNVLGTAFNVRAYANEKSTEATLVRGTIEVVLRKSNKHKIILRPSEKIVVQNITPVSSAGITSKMPVIGLFNSRINEKDTTTPETEWTKNRLVFEQERLEVIVSVLERWYDVDIEVQNPIRSRLYNGTFENDRLEDVLESLKNVGGFNYRIEKEKHKVVIF